MFKTLIESSAPGPTDAFSRLVAFSLHGILAIGAIIGTHGASNPGPTPVAVPIPILTEPAPRPTTTATATVTTAPSPITAAPSAPDIPIVTPDRISIAVPEVGSALPKTGARELAYSDLPHGLGSTTDAAGDAILLAGEVDEPATVIRAETPVYPPAMASAGIAGKVSLEFVVDTLGWAEPASLRIASSTSPTFESAARAAILGTLYRPAKARGRVVRQLVRQGVAFNPR